jgi:hypothetical protein
LTRLVALNHERAAEEKRGIIRWLRPEYQRGGDHRSPSPPEASIQENLAGTETSDHSKSNVQNSTLPTIWPATLSAQVAAIQKLLPAAGPDAAALAGHFGKRTKPRIQQISEILETLRALGKL